MVYCWVRLLLSSSFSLFPSIFLSVTKDDDGDGTIDVHELRAWLRRVKTPVSKRRALRFLAKADVDEDGGCDYVELLEAMAFRGDLILGRGRKV